MAESRFQQALITYPELQDCAHLIETRYGDAALETARLDLSRRFLTAALVAERALRAHSRCAVVNHCGSHGNSNLEDLSTELLEALLTYAALIRESASQYRRAFGEAGSRVEPGLVREVA